ncbi:response regulator receiver and Hpt phospho transfer protein [Desulfovibrio sp. X2]|uniref:response regulator n=1 Tax=Desulfovibrio sp. X2 TaxID=941449 RepID=UPI000358DBC3|nr:response regulator [Desulfovibrio sp. X2]EPR44371.1 response regulator receiver and Hpt phospho transfer protein [Desulfovibrio sp. X2]
MLVVEDERVSAMHTERMLRRAGFSSRLAGCGEEALAAFAAESFDAVLVDLGLPDMDGLTLAARMREMRAPSCPAPTLIALSGDAPEEVMERAAPGLLDGALAKPLCADALHCLLRPLQAQEPTKPDFSLLDDDASLAREFAALFLEDLPHRLRRLHAAMAEGDCASLCRHAHSLKSTTAMVGADGASEAARGLERAARAERIRDCPALLAALERDLEAVRSGLARLTSF